MHTLALRLLVVSAYGALKTGEYSRFAPSENGDGFLVGSLYGGIFIGLEADGVTSVFIGASAE